MPHRNYFFIYFDHFSIFNMVNSKRSALEITPTGRIIIIYTQIYATNINLNGRQN